MHSLSASVSAGGVPPMSAAGEVMAMQRGDKVVVTQALQAWVET
jgi:hypothetical protein